jgi:fructose-bisphosphate aldolase, class I
MLTRRLSRIFRRDGRALIVAIDHGMTEGPVKGLESPAETLAAIVAGGADAVLAGYGTAIRFEQALAPVGLILRIDGGSTSIGKLTPAGEFYAVADALRLGADAVAVSAFPGTPQEEMSLRNLAATITDAHRWGMPVLGEMQPGGFDAGPEYHTIEKIAIAARVAAELGADWVKMPYAAGYSRVVQTCYVPVVMLGGVKAGNERVLLETIHQAIQDGAAGVAIGRNIFQAQNPRAMTSAVAAIIHKGASVEEALGLLRAQ